MLLFFFFPPMSSKNKNLAKQLRKQTLKSLQNIRFMHLSRMHIQNQETFLKKKAFFSLMLQGRRVVFQFHKEIIRPLSECYKKVNEQNLNYISSTLLIFYIVGTFKYFFKSTLNLRQHVCNIRIFSRESKYQKQKFYSRIMQKFSINVFSKKV